MGGAIAQIVAVPHPERVASVTAISTAAIREENPGLPGPTAEYMEHAAAFDDLDWSDRQPLAEFLVRDSHPQGVALAEAVPGATLVTIEGGHELHERDWDQMLDAIAAHTAIAA